MNAMLTFPLPVATDFIERLERRVLRDIHDSAEEWSRCIQALTQWERQHLLPDSNKEVLNQHKVLAENLLHLGKLLRAASSAPEFPDQTLAQTVAAGVQILEDKLLMWHAPMPPEEADRLLREVGLL